ncbi:MAG TPA: hypothetical protein PK006_12305 [Saprospiraceae bacterium]|nr:hypothetical protein [Saprospiraceae bacterium]
MYANEKEFDAVHAAIDFITSQSDGADDDKYPHDVIEGLRSLFDKIKKDREQKHFKYLVNKELVKLRAVKNGS